MIVSEILSLAQKVNNYQADATSGGLWTSTTTFVVTVPTGYRYFVLGGIAAPNVNGSTLIEAYDSSNQRIFRIAANAAGTTPMAWPCQTADDDGYNAPGNIILDAGEYIKITFGAVQGAAAYCSCVVLAISV